jgi:NhaP-type Na+/H+ or K+/H+ antiporter
VCWWGGLHGGVGLALALAMESGLRQAGEPEQGMRVLLHVAVAAMLTLLVNAPTIAPLLKKLNLTSTSEVKQQRFIEAKQRINAFAWAQCAHSSPSDPRPCDGTPPWIRSSTLATLMPYACTRSQPLGPHPPPSEGTRCSSRQASSPLRLRSGSLQCPSFSTSCKTTTSVASLSSRSRSNSGRARLRYSTPPPTTATA